VSSYPKEFLSSLAEFGLAPTAETPPELVREALNDLYRQELRRLRDRHRAGDLPKPIFLDAVVAMRKKYWLLTLPLSAWQRIWLEHQPIS
jgi:hypothetical protein